MRACLVRLLCCRLITDTTMPNTMRGQLELFAAHGIFIAVTGAALMNTMFLTPFSSVIEIFPPGFDHNLGAIMSVTAGQGYFPIHTHNLTGFRDHGPWEQYKAQGCDAITGLTLVGSVCTQLMKPWPVESVNVAEFESAFVSAVDHAGHALRHRAYAGR